MQVIIPGLLRTSLVLLAFFVFSTARSLHAQDEYPGEFDAHGSGVERVEFEAKIRVPMDEREAVWTWMQRRYSDPSWLDQDGSSFRVTFGDEDFSDRYFDTPSLQMLELESGIRHRSRIVHSGSAKHKDGRQLLQVKLKRGEDGLARTEVKFKVDPRERIRVPEDGHPLLGLIDADDRPEFLAVLRAIGVDGHAARPILTVDQNRRRVYLSDQHGAYATLTLDLCRVSEWGVDLEWVEIELELNEIRFTEADEASKRAMGQTIATIQRDLMEAFPRLEQDQTPKYNKAFAALEAEKWFSVRTVLRMGGDPASVTGLAAVFGMGLVGATGYAGWASRQRRTRDGRP